MLLPYYVERNCAVDVMLIPFRLQDRFADMLSIDSSGEIKFKSRCHQGQRAGRLWLEDISNTHRYWPDRYVPPRFRHPPLVLLSCPFHSAWRSS
jgi:hypothetical protein